MHRPRQLQEVLMFIPRESKKQTPVPLIQDLDRPAVFSTDLNHLYRCNKLALYADLYIQTLAQHSCQYILTTMADMGYILDDDAQHIEDRIKEQAKKMKLKKKST